MASAPLHLLTNVLDSPSYNANVTPRKQSKSHLSPIRAAYDQSSGLSLNLKSVLGATTSSVSGFDCLTSRSCFATCAGSAGIVNYVDDKLNITQRFFRARPSVIGPTTSGDPGTPNTPDWRNRQVASLRGNNSGAKGPASPSADFTASPNKSALRQRTRAANCVSLSPDGRILAVGETGYVPRILLFFTASNSTEFPFATLPEHGYGVRCLSFSHDSRWLFSVGDVHDGFVYLWAVNPRTSSPKLFSSNKCTSFIHDMIWLGNSVVTVGIRHVKVWRPDQTGPPSPSKAKHKSENIDSTTASSASKTLLGRNCILGSMLESTFTCIAALSDTKAVICTDKGDVCILDDNDGAQKLYRTRKLDYGVNCVTVDKSEQRIWFGGRNGEIVGYSYGEIETINVTRPSGAIQAGAKPIDGAQTQSSSTFVALGLVNGRLVSIGSDHHLRVLEVTKEENGSRVSSCVKHLPAHAGPVLGVNVSKSSDEVRRTFMTWDAIGTAIFWTLDGQFEAELKVPLEQFPSDILEDAEANELKILRPALSGKYYISGDKYGVLRLLKDRKWDDGTPIKAHNGEVNDIVIEPLSGGVSLIASCGRDRTVQLYEERDMEMNLIQTIDQHGSSVNALMLINNGQTLLSASSDRTVIVHSFAEVEGSKAYVPTRVLTLKQSPISLALDADDSNIISITTMDKQLHKYELSSGQCINSVRLLDDNNISVLLASTETRTINGPSGALRLLLGVSATDKSVRVHDLESGSTLVRDYGHSEGITNVAVIQEQDENATATYTMVSTGLDGTVMLWELTHSLRAEGDQSACASPLPETPSFSQPLRRVLSRSAIAEFSKTLEASGTSPVPPIPSTPSRSQSPSRLRRRLSKYSLGGPPSKMVGAPILRRPERSPSPPSPAGQAPVPSQRKTMHRAKSMGNFNDVNFAADQLCKALRAFRKKAGSSSDVLALPGIKELEREMNLTAKIIDQHSRRHHHHPASDTNVGDLLDQYSDKLAQMVEEKVALSAVTKEKRRHKSEGAYSSASSSSAGLGIGVLKSRMAKADSTTEDRR